MFVNGLYYLDEIEPFVRDTTKSRNSEQTSFCARYSEHYWKFWTLTENSEHSEHYWKFWTLTENSEHSEHYWKFWTLTENSEHSEH